MVDDQGHDGNAVQDDLADLVRLERRGRGGRGGRGRGVMVGGSGWSQGLLLVGACRARHYDVIRAREMGFVHTWRKKLCNDLRERKEREKIKRANKSTCDAAVEM